MQTGGNPSTKKKASAAERHQANRDADIVVAIMERAINGINYARIVAADGPQSKEAKSFRKLHPSAKQDLSFIRSVVEEVRRRRK